MPLIYQFIKSIIPRCIIHSLHSCSVIAAGAWIDLYTIAANIYIRHNVRIYCGGIDTLRLPSALYVPRTVRSVLTYTANRPNDSNHERNVGAEDGLRDKKAYRDQSITKSRVRVRLYTGVNHPAPPVTAESRGDPPKVKRFLKYCPARHSRDKVDDRDSCVLSYLNEPIKFS